MKRITLEIVTAEETKEEIVNCEDCVLFSRCLMHYDCPLLTLLADEDEAIKSIIKTFKEKKL